MQNASESVPSGLLVTFLNKNSDINLAMMAARKWCVEKLRLPKENVECSIANYLMAKCKVIGGNKEALDFIQLNHKEFKIDKVKPLPVSGAFHTKLMKPAEHELASILKITEIREPTIKYYSNYDGKVHTSPVEIRKLLLKQMSSPVRWEQTLNDMYYDHNLPLAQDDTSSDSTTLLVKRESLGKESDTEGGEEEKRSQMTKKQTPDRIYPDIYECGAGAQSGPILNFINYKAYKFYKHINV